MKKLLSVLLVIVLAAALFTGCTPKQTQDPKATPTPVVQNGLKIDPQYSDSKDENGIWNDVITFNVFNTDDYQSRWYDSAKAWMLDEFHIKVGYVIPAIQGFSDCWFICQNKVMEDPSNRAEYNSKLASLFLSETTQPDYLPALYSSCVGSEGAWFTISEHLTDLEPYLIPGGTLYDTYVNWVWGDHKDYWETMKEYLKDENGHLYVIPRREVMPIQTFLGYSQTSLKKLGVSWEDKPTDWDGFVELLRRYMALDEKLEQGNIVRTALRTNEENGADIVQFVATTYGLDFNADFSWTTKNGEPLWTYYWDEYLEILKNVNMLAAEELVVTNAEEPSAIAGYMLDKTDIVYKASIKGQELAGGYSGIASYTRDDKIAWFNAAGDLEWKVSDTWVSQNGYEYSMVGGSEFDSNYLAIGNRLGDVFVSRIIDFWNFSMDQKGLFYYLYGQEGTPFAETPEEAGNYVLDEQNKVVFSNSGNRFSFTKVENHYWWDSRDADWWININENYKQYIEKYDANMYGNVGINDGTTLREYLGTNTNVWERGTELYRRGTYFFADVTAYPMENTAYWPDEGVSKTRELIKTVESTMEENNTACYKGFFRSTKEVLGRDSSEMDKKIATLKKIAKEYTIDFLCGMQTEAGWTNYIKNLQDAGYDDVYAYYELALTNCVTEKKDGVKSQSDVNTKRA